MFHMAMNLDATFGSYIKNVGKNAACVLGRSPPGLSKYYASSGSIIGKNADFS